MSAEAKKTIYITEFDLERLEALLERLPSTPSRRHLDGLQYELARAQVVSPQEIPSDVITMNSKVNLVDVDTGEEDAYTLVFPEDANIEAGRISITAPLGTAMLGYQVGDTFEWEVPAGVKRWRIEKILYQPEAAGDYHL